MIKVPTVLILGAGASIDYGFPLGRTLLFSIIDGVENKGKDTLFQHLRKDGFSEDEIDDFATALKESPWSSVDVFLMNRTEFGRIGKYALALTLIPCEKWLSVSSQRVRERTHLYEYLFQAIGSTMQEFYRHQLSIITFNYDRSFEEYLYRTLKSAFGLDVAKAFDLASTVEIYHIYGRLGATIHEDKRNGRHYSPDLKQIEVAKIVENIKIFSENVSSRELSPAIELIRQSEIICFLGFSYHDTNLTNLGVKRWFRKDPFFSGKPPVIFGTAYGLNPAQVEDIRNIFNNKITLGSAQDKALDFLQNNRILR